MHVGAGAREKRNFKEWPPRDYNYYTVTRRPTIQFLKPCAASRTLFMLRTLKMLALLELLTLKLSHEGALRREIADLFAGWGIIKGGAGGEGPKGSRSTLR